MDRLTTPDGDYCHDVCKCVNSCKLLKEGRPLCSDVARYERLRMYENLYARQGPETNRDRLRAMSSQELARWICDLMPSCTICPFDEACRGAAEGVLKWLEDEADE